MEIRIAASWERFAFSRAQKVAEIDFSPTQLVFFRKDSHPRACRSAEAEVPDFLRSCVDRFGPQPVGDGEFGEMAFQSQGEV